MTMTDTAISPVEAKKIINDFFDSLTPENVLSLPDEKKIILTKIGALRSRQKAEKSFYEFFRQSWPYIWPTAEFKTSWFYEMLCDELQGIVERNIRGEARLYHLNVNIPPGTGKTSIISIALPVWVWIKNANKRFITTSYSPLVAEYNNNKSTDLMKSPWFRQNWGHLFALTKTIGTEVMNNKGGRRITTSPGSKIGTGFHADFIIGDDNQNAEEVYSTAYRTMVIRWQDETMSTRFVDRKSSVMINLQQRLHQEDLTGHFKSEQASLYKFIVLPAEDSYEIEPPEFKQKYVDHLLFPSRLPWEVLEAAKTQLRNAYAGQYGQTPIAIGGNFFKESWVNWFTPEQLPKMERVLISADTANTDLATSCPVSIQVWGQARPNFYLLYDETMIMSQLETENRIKAIWRMYVGSIVVIELAASGFGILERLKRQLPGVFAFPPGKYGGKESRADIITYLWQAGNIYLPDTQYIKTQYLPEILTFPNGKYKDRVDAMSQALIFMTREFANAIKNNNNLPVY